MASWFKSLLGKAETREKAPAKRPEADYKLVLPEAPENSPQSMGKAGPHIIETDYFRLALGEDWLFVESRDGADIFDHKDGEMECTISTMGLNAVSDKLKGICEQLIEFRLEAHDTMSEERGTTYEVFGPNFVETSWGWQGNYDVSDRSEYMGTFCGLVGERFILNIYLDLRRFDPDHLHKTFADIMQTLLFTDLAWGSRPIAEGGLMN